MKIAFISLGCKVNNYEVDAIKDLFVQSGDEIVSSDEEFDACIINSCTVTNQASAKSRKMIRSAIRSNPNAIVAVMGCYSQVFSKELKEIEGLNIIIGNVNKANIVDLIHNYKGEKIVEISDIFACRKFENLSPKTFSHTRAFLKIEDGCNNFCTYCIIPYSRGPIRSKDSDDVIKDINEIVSNGYKEVVLTGIHTGKYQDEKVDFTGLVKRILNETELKRLRISSIEINEVTDELIDMMKEYPHRLAHHLHIPLQAGSSAVLKKMNRHYDKEQFVERIKYIQSQIEDISITTDIIVGFPEETDDDFKETLEVAKEVKFAKIHCFPFSLREGTKACQLEQVSEAVKDERMRKLMDLDQYLEKQFMLKMINEIVEVIIEEDKGNFAFGHSSNYLPIYVPANKVKKNKFVSVRITNYNDLGLYGRPVDR